MFLEGSGKLAFHNFAGCVDELEGDGLLPTDIACLARSGRVMVRGRLPSDQRTTPKRGVISSPIILTGSREMRMVIDALAEEERPK